MVGFRSGCTLIEAASGAHAIVAGMFISATITAGTATATLGATAYFSATAWATGTTDGATVYISNAGSGATNNYSLFIDAGLPRIDSTTAAGAGVGTLTNVPNAAGGNPAVYFLINTGGTSYAVPGFAL